MSSFSLIDFACWLVVFLGSMTAHEASHAFVAKCLGDPTAYLGGQVTLNPIPHVRREPFGMLLLPIISYLASGWMIGWASAPYNAGWAAKFPRRAAVMALEAGKTLESTTRASPPALEAVGFMALMRKV